METKVGKGGDNPGDTDVGTRSSTNTKGEIPVGMSTGIQNYWGSGRRLSSGILKTRTHSVLETGSVSEALLSSFLEFWMMNKVQNPIK
jgi:hypothetical protein